MVAQKNHRTVVIPTRILRNENWREIRDSVILAAKGRFPENSSIIGDMLTAISLKLDDGVPAGCGMLLDWNEYDIPQITYVKMPKQDYLDEISCV